jgi:hypothetical protein
LGTPALDNYAKGNIASIEHSTWFLKKEGLFFPDLPVRSMEVVTPS